MSVCPLGALCERFSPALGLSSSRSGLLPWGPRRRRAGTRRFLERPVSEIPREPVTPAGHADKEQVQMMVRRLLPGCAIASPDAADALAVAICHAHHANTLRVWQPVRESTGR